MIYLLLAFIYCIVKELEEAAWHNTYPKSWTWWNQETSWVNKHNWGEAVANRVGFAKDFIKYLFRTSLVFITDAEHFLQLLNALVLGFTIYTAIDLNAGLLFVAGYFIGGTFKEILKLFGINIMK